MKFLPALVCALLLSTACKKTQEPANETAQERAKETFPAATAAGVDRQMERAVQSGLIPGAVVVIGHNGRMVYQKAYGSRAIIPQREPMTLDTVFDAASLTKVIATTPSIMRLFEQGQIRLNDPVTNYLPEFQGGHSDITIRNLMTHFSGLRPDLDLKPAWSGYGTGIQRALNDKPAGPPGVQCIVLQSVGGNILRISDVPGPSGGILLQSSSGASIAINDAGITITNGQATILIAGPSVTVNDGALVVT